MLLKATVQSEEDYKTVTRPAVYDSLRRMLKFYGLESTAEIFYNGNNEIAKLVGSNTSDQIRTNLYTDGVFRNKLFVKAEFEETNFNSGFSNQRREMTERPVWMTKHREPSMIYPSLSGLIVNVSVIANFNSKKLADQFERRINRAQSEQAVAFNFSAVVHLPVNNTIVAMMHNLYRLYLKNEPDTTPATFSDWFKQYHKVPFVYVSDESGKNPRLAVPMSLDEIGIYFKEARIRKSRNADVFGKYEVELSYFFYFHEFVGWELQYPLSIYQDDIDALWIPRPDDGFKKKFNIRVNPEYSFGRHISGTRTGTGPDYIRLPDHDPWKFTGGDWLQPIVQVRLKIADQEVQQLGNIFEIPGLIWNEQIKNYITRRRDVVFTQSKSPFYITVWSEDIQVLPERLSMDENGMVTLLTRPNMQNRYRLVVVCDFAVRDYFDSFWTDLMHNPDDEAMLPGLFPGFDWADLPKPWSQYSRDICKGINKGRGLKDLDFNRYMASLGLNAYLFIEDVRNV